MSLLQRFFLAVIITACFSTPVFGQSGKIAGTVTDAETGNPLPGVNVVIEGAQQGATTNTEGYYAILNVSPGVYTLRATFVGFAPTVQEGVQVNIDLTTEVDFELQEQTEQLEEVTVQATEPVVKPDISANVSNLSSGDIENMPVVSLEDVVGLQAGVQGLSVRGGDLSSLGFQVNGSSTFDGRANQPFTGVSFTSIEQVQVQTGGFNAEYGNVRSGLVNVVTKEGPRDEYVADALIRYSPASRNYFDHAPNSGINGGVPVEEMGYYVRPFMDPDVAFVGTHSEESPWDLYERGQYLEWEGWNAYAERRMNDEDPNNNLTPEQWQQVYQYYHRKSFKIDDPNYELDGSFGGPVPGISDYLGDLRFLASYRQTQDPYIVPQNRDSHQDYLGRLRLTSDVAPSIKLELQGMLSREYGHNATTDGGASYFTGEPGSFNMIDRMNKSTRGYEFFLFADDGWSLQDIERNMLGIDLTHTLGSNTFYTARLNRMDSKYFAYKGPFRDDSTIVKQIGTLGLNEAPFGMSMKAANTSPTSMALGGYWSSAEDSSWSKRWDGSFEITSQVNRWSQLKGGVDFIYTRHRRKNRATTIGYPQLVNDWQRNTAQGAAFVQNKLEFEGLIANVGLRLDYFKGAGDWYHHTLFDTTLGSTAQGTLDELLNQEPIEAQYALSPRLGVSFPITENSKMFFNYGHFREMLEPSNIFRVYRHPRTGAVGYLGNPNHPMPKTVAYELGYEHNLFNQFLLRITGYYKDLSEQPRWTGFQGDGGNVDYSTSLPYSYEDIRGVEFSLNRSVGHIRGWINYTYMARKSGEFGFGEYIQNPVQRQEYMREFRNRQWTPVPQPYARFNLSLIVPQHFGPSIGQLHPLADWRISFLGSWEAGRAFTWCGGGGTCPEGLSNNVRWKSRYNLDGRLSKVFDTQVGQVMVFADVTNALNIKRLNEGSFMVIGEDRTSYMRSLHLSEDTFEDIDPPPYSFIPGDDRPGDYREPGVEFVPIEIVSSLEGVDNPSGRALYYHAPGNIEDGAYQQFVDGEWQQANPEEVDRVLANKAYIDMPNLRAFRFLYPRDISFGVRYTF